MRDLFNLRKIVVTNEDGKRYELVMRACANHLKSEADLRKAIEDALNFEIKKGGDIAVFYTAVKSRPIVEIVAGYLNWTKSIREL